MIAVEAPGARQVLHRHGEARLVLLLRGDLEESGFEGAGRFTCGDFVFRPAFFAHADQTGRDGSAYARVHVSRATLRAWLRRHGWCAGRGRIEPGGKICGDELVERASPGAYALKAARTPMHRAAVWLEAAEAPRMREVAEHLELTPSQFTRCFASAFGLAPNRYRRQARLQRAIRMISEDASTLAEIAVAAGFHDQSHLTAELKRETGLTPRALRAELAA